MVITKLGGGYIAAVFPNSGIDRETGKPTAEKIYGIDEEELKRRIKVRFSEGATRGNYTARRKRS